VTPRRLAWLAMILGAVAAAVLRGWWQAPHWAALLAGVVVAAAVGLGVSVAAEILREEKR
jgi:ABC-type uncharacterized transport system permease subunit